MKITLDLTSVVVGGAVALTLGVVAGFSPQVTSVPAARPATAVTTMGANRPAARDIVHLQAKNADFDSAGLIAGTSFSSPLYTVPPGKILVLTGMSSSTDAAHYTNTPWASTVAGYAIEVDGLLRRYQVGATRTISFDVGIPLSAGQTVRVLEPSSANGVQFQSTIVNLHGYLEDA